MTYLASGVGFLLGLFIMVVSGMVNARYGMMMFNDDFDRQVMVSVAIFTDIAKATSWIYFARALVRREVISAILSFIMFTACMAWAVSGALGYISLNRNKASELVLKQAELYGDTQAQLKRKTGALQALGNVEPAAVWKKRIEAMRADKRFVLTSECTSIIYDSHRSFCASWGRLGSDYEKAVAYEKLEQEIAELRSRHFAGEGVVNANEGDVQGAVIAQLANLKVSTVQVGLSLLFVTVLECGACYMLWLSMNHFRGEQAHARAAQHEAQLGGELSTAHDVQERARITETKPKQAQAQDFIAYANQELELEAGEEIDTRDIVTSFKGWCAERCLEPLSDEMIAKGISQLARADNVRSFDRDGRNYLVGVALHGGKKT